MSTILEWDKNGERQYQTGIDRVALYHLYSLTTGTVTKDEYRLVAAWNGVSALNESPSGAESNKIYADNQEYLNLISNEELSVTLEAYTSPEQFDECDGMASPVAGMKIHGASRRPFALAYRVWKGNDEKDAGSNYGYEYHLLYGCKAGVASRDNATINDSPEAGTFSWEISTEKVEASGSNSPTSHVIIDIASLRDGVLVGGVKKTAITTAATGSLSSVASAVDALLFDTDKEANTVGVFKDKFTDTTLVTTNVNKGKCPKPAELSSNSAIAAVYNA